MIYQPVNVSALIQYTISMSIPKDIRNAHLDQLNGTWGEVTTV